MTVHDRIEINPKIMLGKPVIRGTRIPVELIVRKMAEGADEKALLQAYPNLTQQDVHAALRYAADSLAHEEVGTEHRRVVTGQCVLSPTRIATFQW